MCTKMSQAEQLESNSHRVFGSLSQRCYSQRQLVLSVKQLITQTINLKRRGGSTHTHAQTHIHTQRQHTPGVYL